MIETEIHAELKNLCRKFAESRIRTIVVEDEKTETFRPEIIRELGNLGLCGVIVDQQWEGAGLGTLANTFVIRELARVCAGYAISVSVTGLAQSIIQKFGTTEQKSRYLPPLAKGEMIGAFSLSEASSGSDAGSLRTNAKKVAGGYEISGSKLWCTQADVAGIIILMARTGGPGPKGVSAFIVDGKTPGLKMGKREHKMGMHVSHTMEVQIEKMFVPESQRLSQEGTGFLIAMDALDSGRINIGAAALGLGESALSVAVQYAREREQFGKPIAEFQAIQFMVADMATRLEASKHLVHSAACLKDQGKNFTKEAAMAKLFATDTAMSVTTDCVQILGGAGYTQEFPLERFMREAKVLQIVEGTNQIQRLVVGRHCLKGNV